MKTREKKESHNQKLYIVGMFGGPTFSDDGGIPKAMMTLIALYRRPENPEEFEKHFREIHIPLVRAYPGLKRLEFTRTDPGGLDPERWLIIEEMVFESRDALDAALASSAGKAVTRDLMNFAGPLVSITFGTMVQEQLP